MISDNASTDDTAAVCQRYQGEDSRVIYIRNEENIGVAANYNRVFEVARGAYFKWASVNDYCDSAMIEVTAKALDERSDVVLCCPGTRLVYEDGSHEDYTEQFELDHPSRCERFRRLLEGMRLNNIMNGLFRSSALKRSMLHASYVGSDLPFMAEMVLYGPVVMLPEYLLYRRVDKDSATRHRSRNELWEYFCPQGTGMARFERARQLFGFYQAIRRAKPPWRERICLYSQVAKMAYWSRKRLVQEALAWR